MLELPCRATLQAFALTVLLAPAFHAASPEQTAILGVHLELMVRVRTKYDTPLSGFLCQIKGLLLRRKQRI